MIDSYAIRSKHRNLTLDFYKSKEVWAFYLKSENLLVSTYGNVKSYLTGKMLKTQTTKQGYKVLSFKTLNGKRKTKHIQRLVAETFIPCKNKSFMEVNHINGIKSDNSINNLEWMTRQENLQHARDNNLFKQQFGKSNGLYKYSSELVLKIKEDKRNYTINELIKKYNLSRRQILHILYRRKDVKK